jgi:hypothetical protein
MTLMNILRENPIHYSEPIEVSPDIKRGICKVKFICDQTIRNLYVIYM